ncbi:hypothetical protein BgAZ_100140 [Babesia gibsoni]|uniref:Uncharacterized protein n=1 Tax=Babesia gibsoni TaxID=33632 RepID=A0AAD8PEZ3_BABGI|nr:hypothetical protein BgAZ_100140 [Babesia gibsoni]
MSPNSEVKAPAVIANEETMRNISDGPEELNETLGLLHEEIQNLLVQHCAALYKQWSSIHQGNQSTSNHRRALKNTSSKDDLLLELIKDKQKHKGLIHQIKYSKTIQKNKRLSERLSAIRDHQRHKEQIQLENELKKVRSECSRLRKYSTTIAKEALGTFTGTPIMSFLDSVLEESELIEKSQKLRKRYETLKNVNDNLQRLYHKFSESASAM